MGISDRTWEEDAFLRVGEAMEISKSEAQVGVFTFGMSSFQSALLEKAIRLYYPRFDLQTCRNGIGSHQLASLLGHYAFYAEMVDQLTDFMLSKRDCIDRAAKFIETRKSAEFERLSCCDGLRLRVQIRRCYLIQAGVEMICGLIPEAKRIAKNVSRCISEIVMERAMMGDADSQRFLNDFAKAKQMRVVSNTGMIRAASQRNQKSSEIYVRLLLHSPRLEKNVKNIPELHRALVRIAPDESVLCRDPESPEWDKDFKTLEYVCKEVGLKLAEVGRPQKE